MTASTIVLTVFPVVIWLRHRSACTIQRIIYFIQTRWLLKRRLFRRYDFLVLTLALMSSLLLATTAAMDARRVPGAALVGNWRDATPDTHRVEYFHATERYRSEKGRPSIHEPTLEPTPLPISVDKILTRQADSTQPTVHQYFIPFSDRELIDLFGDSNNCQGQQSSNPVGDILTSRISLTASSNDTTYYYDHYEDDYDADPLTPGFTTETGNLDAGETRILADDIDTTDLDNPESLYYGGRDRITVVGEDVAVVRAAYPSLAGSQIGSNLAGAWEIEEVAEWGMTYIIPIGEDWGEVFGAPQGHDFEFTGASFMALQDATEIKLFHNPEPICFLNAGETCPVNGRGDGANRPGLNSGDTIIASGPIQAHVFSSICELGPSGGNPWSGNGYTLEPRSQWSNHYWSPVPNRADCSDADVDIFLYNPNPVISINITVDDGTIYTPILLPNRPSSVTDLIGSSLSGSRGVEIYSQGEPFWGIVNVDTLDVAYEWGFSLIPEEELSSEVVIGWAPGNSSQPPLAAYPPSGNLAWVTVITNSVVFVDFDRDGNADLIDCNGDGDAADPGECNGHDETDSHNGVPLSQGQTLRVADPNDADMTSALIYTQDLSKRIAVVWGEDPCTAETGVPYLDLGYTALPVSIPSISKSDGLAFDVDGSGDITPGDLLTYTIAIFNNGFGPMYNAVMTDALPYTYTNFVVGSVIAMPLSAVSCEYDDGDGSFSYTPVPTGTRSVDPAVQQLRCHWPLIEEQQRVIISFRVEIKPDIPPDVLEFSNQAIASSAETQAKESRDPDDPQDPDTDTRIYHPLLDIAKLVNAYTVEPGNLLTYTIVISNVGTGAATNSVVVDSYPSWLTYEPNTLDVTWPVAHVITTVVPISQALTDFNETSGDNFDLPAHITGTTGWTGHDGTLAWNGPWMEINDDGDETDGDIQIKVNAGSANSPHAFLLLQDDDDEDSGLMRCADLSMFMEPHLSYNMRGVSDASADDSYRVEITTTTQILTFTQVSTNARYVSRDLDLSDFAGSPNVCIAFFAEAGMDGSDKYRIDDIFIYEAFPARIVTTQLISTSTVISYVTRRNIDPVYYYSLLSHTIEITNGFYFPPGSRFTAAFQMRAGFPLTNGLVMINTGSVTATNLHAYPFPLENYAPTQVRSDHVLTVSHFDSPDPARPGQLLTYSIFWEATGDETAPNVTVTDVLPLSYVSFFSCAGGVSCGEYPSPGSGVVIWELGNPLPPMSGKTYASGWLTLTVRVKSRPLEGYLVNTVTIDDDTDTPPDEDNEQTNVEMVKVYLPLILRRWPSPPPNLDPIDNLENDGDYTVHWSEIQHSSTITYVLQEDQVCDCDLIDPTDIYTYTNTYPVKNKKMGRYCYRVQACDRWGCTAWSDIECVDVLLEHKENANGLRSQAEGPLCSSLDYYGRPDDEWDFFKICLDTTGQIKADLSEYAGRDMQFQLLDQDGNLKRRIAVWMPDPNEHYILECFGTEGEYFIGISTDDESSWNDELYTLQAILH